MPSRINRSRILIVTLAAAALLTACSGSEGDGGGGASGGSDIPWTRVSPDELNARLQAEDVYLVNVHTPYEGYSGFSELTGGYSAWTEAGLPFEVKTPAG